MFREIFDNVYWIEELGPSRDDIAREALDEDWYIEGRDVHVPQNAFLFVDDRTLLFDTTSPANREQMTDDLDDILGDRTLDYLVVSHPDVPHAGNTHAILEQYPDATLVAPSYGDMHELYHLADSRKVDVGERINVGKFTVQFQEAPILDAPMTHWMTEEHTDMLLPVDWVCFPHTDEETLKFADEMPRDITVERLLQFNARVLFWMQYVDPEKLNEEIDAMIDRYDPDVIAPSHGVVIRENATGYLEKCKYVVEHISEHGRKQTL